MIESNLQEWKDKTAAAWLTRCKARRQQAAHLIDTFYGLRWLRALAAMTQDSADDPLYPELLKTMDVIEHAMNVVADRLRDHLED